MDSLSVITLLALISTQILCYFFVIRNKQKFKFFEYEQIQQTHYNFTPRLGGIIIFISFYLFLSLQLNQHSLNQILLFFCGFLIILISTKEDLYANVSAKIRFTIILFSSLLSVLFLDKLPSIDIFLISKIFKNDFVLIIFYTLCIALITNGINIIDGLNGHASLSIASSLICLIYLNNANVGFYSFPFILLIFLLIFFFFNFPFGYIFLGDAGAHWLGWMTSIFVINFFAINSEISNWLAVIILFYPAMEVLFSFTRKLILNRSPFEPDLDHIHIKMYHFINSRFANPLSTLMLMPLTIFPIGYVYCVINFNISIILIIILQISIYLAYFLILPRVKSN